MKKTITLLAVLLFISITAQEFKLTADNFRDVNNPSKDYYVVDIPGKTQEELFKKAKSFINATYKGVKFDGYNENAPEQIVIDVNRSIYKVLILQISGPNLWDIDNRYELNFKDGKMMIRPFFRKLQNSEESRTYFSITSFFNKKGEPRKQKAISFINEYTNQFVANFISEMKSEAKSDW